MSTKFDPSKDLLSQIKRNPIGSSWKNEKVEINENFSISIQAGENFYCYPKNDSELNSDYQQFEIALFTKINNRWEFFSPGKYFPDLSWTSLFEDSDSPVAGYLEISKIENIIKDVIRYGKFINFI